MNIISICKSITKKSNQCKNKSHNKYCYLHINKNYETNIIFNLPNELIIIIYKYLDIQSKLNILKTCKKMNDIFKNNFQEINLYNVFYLIENNICFKYIYILFLNHIKNKENKDLKIYGSICFEKFKIIVIYGKIMLKMKFMSMYVHITVNKTTLYQILDGEWIINDFINIIDLIYEDFKKNKKCITDNIANIFRNYQKINLKIS